MSQKKTCFVIMGYGLKTDYTSGRVLNLDKTYENIIKPAVEELNIECKRSDEVRHSGNIDIPMYKYILSADIVIADLSTNNPNALYELGVRHALRPYTTIAISEKELKRPFDLDHTVIRQYEHLGNDIGFSEVLRFKKELQDLIKEILDNPEIDSPVYTFLTKLKQPQWMDDETHESTYIGTDSLSQIIEHAEKAMQVDDFAQAKVLFAYARTFDKENTYVIQRQALCTYKIKQPNHVSALHDALTILEELSPHTSTDPETLGLCGAINKRLWEELQDINYLNLSIKFYKRGFYIKSDYYNGINLAYLLNIRGSMARVNDAITDYTLANRIRSDVIDICNSLIVSGSYEERTDKYWIMATLEEAYFGLEYANNKTIKSYDLANQKAKQLSEVGWERETTERQIAALKVLLDKSPTINQI